MEATGHQAERKSQVAWFRFAGWLTVEVDEAGTILAISPRTTTTPHIIFEIGHRITPVGGAWQLETALALADHLCEQCGGVFWRREQRSSWAGNPASDRQRWMIKHLGASKPERMYGRWNKGVASGLIGFLRARKQLHEAGWWDTGGSAGIWAPERLLEALTGEGLAAELRFPDLVTGPAQAPVPWTPTPVAEFVGHLVEHGSQVEVLVSAGAGVSRALAALPGQEAYVYADLSGVSGARRMLMALAAAVVSGDPGLTGGTTMSVGMWLLALLEASETRTLVIDHCPRLSTDILHWLGAITRAGVRLILVAPTKVEAERIQKQLGAAGEIAVAPWLSRAEVGRVLVETGLPWLGVRCDRDELPWVSDELWGWLREGEQGVRWRDLAGALRLLKSTIAPATTTLDQAAIQRVRALSRPADLLGTR